jgi:hypothetical protein
LLNLIPQPGEVSFQHGYLGIASTSWIKGLLQLKFTDSSYRATVSKVVVELLGVERIKDASEGPSKSRRESDNMVELIRESKIIWESSQASDVGASTGSSSNPGPPGNNDFEFRLTDDLPHCCHVGSGSLEYSLTARIYGSKTYSCSTPIHLSRTSRPPSSGKANASSSYSSSPNNSFSAFLPPEVYISQHPTEVAVFFPHGTTHFRRSESIELRVRIPPPDVLLVQEKGLKLRSISAELIRTISIRESDVSEEKEISAMLDTPALTTLISHTGKAAAFSPLRSVFLNMWLQPVPQEACECITQSTIFQEISFSIRVTANVMGRDGDREDIQILDRIVNLVPDYPPSSAGDLDLPALDSVQPPFRTTYKSATLAPPSSAIHIDPALLRAFQEEEEYDGYEQLSEGPAAEQAPPAIDADEPPPSLEAESGRFPSHIDEAETDECSARNGASDASSTSIANNDNAPVSSHDNPPTSEEAPPYSSETVSAAQLPESAVETSADIPLQPPAHPDHHHDSNPVPPPPPYERERHADIQEEGLDEQDQQTLREMRQAMRQILTS